MLSVCFFLIRLILGATYLWAGVTKVFDHNSLEVAVVKYGGPRVQVTSVAVRALPVAEMLVGVSLVLGIEPAIGTLGAICLSVVFLVFVTSAVVRHLEIDCGCFGLLYSERLGWHTLLRDIVLLACGVVLGLSQEYPFPLADALTNGPDVGAWSASAASVSVLGVGIAVGMQELRQRREAGRAGI